MITERPKLPHDWVIMDDVIVAVTSPGDISKATWENFIRDLRRPGINYVLNFVRGAVSIDAVKRNDAATAVKENNLTVVVITESRLTRGVLTAVSWMGAKIVPYSWKDIEKALDSVHASQESRLQILKIAEAFVAATPNES